MIYSKQYLAKKEKQTIKVIIDEISDIYGEFYITKNKLRLFIKENIESLWETLKKGDRIIFGEAAVGVITGFADKTIEITDTKTNEKKIIPSRKYVSILAKDERNADRLLQYIAGKFKKIDIYTKIKKDNPILKCFYNNGFIFLHGRGAELLLIKPKNDKKEFIFIKYEDSKPEYKKRKK
jgi:preprotein translocase subunit YajC